LIKWYFILIIGIMLSACQPQAVTSTSMPATNTPTVTDTPVPTETATRTPLPTQPFQIQTSTEVVLRVCSPLEGETLDTLPSIIVNPMVIPAFGRDDGHHGVDFAYYRRGERESIQGIEVYAVINGKTVQTLEDNTPYGYAILIETPLRNLSKELREDLTARYQPIPENVQYQGQCPKIDPPEDSGELSLYHLYAHLEQKPDLNSGDTVPCGALLGTVGNTGRSSNPHLHLETRLGPSGAEFGDMGFYETIYSEEQRADYCLWRMSGYFQLFDPFILFEHGG